MHAGARCFAAVVGDRLESTTTSSAVLRADPDDVSCITLRGRELVYANELDAALPILKRAVELAPNDAFTQASLGFVLFRRYDYRDAARAFERAVELEPRGIHHANAGYAHYHYGNYPAARPHFVKALALGLESEFKARIDEALQVVDGAKWICPMHAHVTGKKGDTCGECGMKLAPAVVDVEVETP